MLHWDLKFRNNFRLFITTQRCLQDSLKYINKIKGFATIANDLGVWGCGGGSWLCLCDYLFKSSEAATRSASGLQPYLKREPNAGVLQWILWNFQEHLFHRSPPDGCFWANWYIVGQIKLVWCEWIAR